jgi:hypothetical protein
MVVETKLSYSPQEVAELMQTYHNHMSIFEGLNQTLEDPRTVAYLRTEAPVFLKGLPANIRSELPVHNLARLVDESQRIREQCSAD